MISWSLAFGPVPRPHIVGTWVGYSLALLGSREASGAGERESRAGEGGGGRGSGLTIPLRVYIAIALKTSH